VVRLPPPDGASSGNPHTTIDRRSPERAEPAAGARSTERADCAVCAALIRQRAHARDEGDECREQECEAELSNHRHDR
jgi:hypothetical protein